ncbi:FAD-binding protein [Roseovarius spongiae]|uniref:Tryptophan 2-monooxygenase n=1 Tax=Roseovarius spongiae TaxID=2320272 RepID=A0A3A8AXD7_9RHOB|nr:NAD(P)/FAD-dependent oxidoreductase [Roseovarius spongiae]RKF16406.1 FAD-binding protein [Roseovarius spongiae]
MSTPEIVIVGAGAAGVGAGLKLQERGVSFVILEAAQRIGGRAFTDTASLSAPWDQGCHWLHCARENPLVGWADRLGAHYARQTPDGRYAAWHEGAFLDGAALAAADAAITRAFTAVEAAGIAGRDAPIPEVLPDLGRWAGEANCLLALMAGDEPRDVSAAAYADYADTEVNWPVLSGYGDLIGRMAAGLPIRTDVPVSRIEQTATGARIETPEGRIDAKGAIVTASTNVLRAGGIAFGPGPAQEFVERLEQIPCGAYEKAAFTLRALPAELEDALFCSIEPGDGEPVVSVQIMKHGPEPMLIVHVAGDVARDLAGAGRAATIDFARGHLARAFGAEVLHAITGSAATGWTCDPLILGSYSHARPGAAQLRRDLIDADTGCVAFAGEALSRQWQATAHGAWASGQDVAARLARWVRNS